MLHVNQRQRLYQFFACLFAHPAAELEQALAEGRAGEVAKLLGIEVPARAAAPLSLADLGELYTGLFVARMGGVPAPLYGSVYLDEGLLMGPSTNAVAQIYRQQGLVFADATEPADHLATELEFLFFLVGKEEAGFAQRDLTAARGATAGQLTFLDEFLLPWLEPFVERLTAVEGDTLYHWGATSLLTFCRQERDWLSRLPK